MHYVRTPRAAVAAPAAGTDCEQAARRQVGANRRSITLWATRPFDVRTGRLVAVRLRGDELQVGLVTPDGLRWLRPEAVMNVSQAERWAHVSTFEVDNRQQEKRLTAATRARYRAGR